MPFLHSEHFQAVDTNGDPLAGAKLYFYQFGTATVITTYQDAELTTPHTSPVVADSAGLFPPIYLNISPYKTQLTDVSGITIQTVQALSSGFDGFVPVSAADSLSTESTDIASASTTDLSTATGVNVTITGANAITAFGVVNAGAHRYITFDDILTLTYNSTSLILPSLTNITTAAGDTALAVSLGEGNWRVSYYTRASGLSVVAQEGSATGGNDEMFGLGLAQQTSKPFIMTNGWADSFGNQAGVDAGTSVNEDYSSTGQFYFGHIPLTFVTASEGTETGNCTAGGGLVVSSNGVTSRSRDQGARSVVDVQTGWVGKDWGGGNERAIGQVKVYGPNDTGLNEGNTTVQIRVQESSTGVWGGEEVTIVDSGEIDTSGANFIITLTCESFSEVRYHRVLVTNPASSNKISFAEVEWWIGAAPEDMTLVSEPYSAIAAPDVGQITIAVIENEAATINTDIVAALSRNGGSTFETATLALVATDGDTKYYAASAIDLSGQSVGTDMVWRVQTANNKNIAVHGVAALHT